MQLIGKSQITKHFGDMALVSNEPESVFSRNAASKDLIVWEAAFWDPEVAKLFETNIWPLKILEAMPKRNGWDWSVENDGYEGAQTEDNIKSLIKSAAGIDQTISGNLHVAMELRDYSDLLSDKGGLLWWKSKLPDVNRNSDAAILYDRIIDVIKTA